MEIVPDMSTIQTWLQQAWTWTDQTVLTFETLGQLLVLLALWAAAAISGRLLKRGAIFLADRYEPMERALPYLRPFYKTVVGVIYVNIAAIIGTAAGYPVYLFEIVASLLTAWIVIRLAAYAIRNRPLARFVALVAWTVAALNIVGWLEAVISALQSATVTLGETTISAYGVLWGIFSFAVLIWGALMIARLLEGRLNTLSGINPSARVLISKTARIILVAVAFLIALQSTGIDLTALAVFGGALGVGLGFGLQKVVSNFISGVILLLDRSIKPGDVIETQNTYGAINSLAARYTSIITRDGTEYLIPNEDMITQPVINWSHSNSNVRRRVPVQVSYESDLRKAMKIMSDAASEHSRILSVPAPRTLLMGFGDSGVDLELRMWISDPQNGVSNVASDVLLEIWDRFHEEGIEIPFPQRVVHFAEGHKPGESSKGKKPAKAVSAGKKNPSSGKSGKPANDDGNGEAGPDIDD